MLSGYAMYKDDTIAPPALHISLQRDRATRIGTSSKHPVSVQTLIVSSVCLYETRLAFSNVEFLCDIRCHPITSVCVAVSLCPSTAIADHCRRRKFNGDLRNRPELVICALLSLHASIPETRHTRSHFRFSKLVKIASVLSKFSTGNAPDCVYPCQEAII